MKKAEQFIFRECPKCKRMTEVRISKGGLMWFRRHGDKNGDLCAGSLKKV